MSTPQEPTVEINSSPQDANNTQDPVEVDQDGSEIIEADSSPKVFVERPTLFQRIRKAEITFKKWVAYWISECRTTIEVHPRYSPIRFSSGLSPVMLQIRGLGFCYYNGKIKWFQNQSIRLTVPMNTSTPILFIGVGQLFKYTLHATSSISHIDPFSVQSHNRYATTVPITPNIKTISSRA